MFAAVLGGTCSSSLPGLQPKASHDMLTKLRATVMTLCGVCCALSLAAVGCINKIEDQAKHGVAGTALMVTSNALGLLLLASVLADSPRRRSALSFWMLCSTAPCTLCKVRCWLPLASMYRGRAAYAFRSGTFDASICSPPFLPPCRCNRSYRGAMMRIDGAAVLASVWLFTMPRRRCTWPERRRLGLSIDTG